MYIHIVWHWYEDHVSVGFRCARDDMYALVWFQVSCGRPRDSQVRAAEGSYPCQLAPSFPLS